MGVDAPGLSATTISRLKQRWKEDFDGWKSRDPSRMRYVYWWADGVYVNARLGEKQCLLVIMGATESGRKELIAVEDGYRESEQSWCKLLPSVAVMFSFPPLNFAPATSSNTHDFGVSLSRRASIDLPPK